MDSWNFRISIVLNVRFLNILVVNELLNKSKYQIFLYYYEQIGKGLLDIKTNLLYTKKKIYNKMNFLRYTQWKEICFNITKRDQN